MADNVEDTQGWPPRWWLDICEAIHFESPMNMFPPNNWGLIPMLDVRQWAYEFLRALVDWIPHQPPEHSRPVLGIVGARFSGGARVRIPLGNVGFNALTRQVFIEVNKQGGPQQQRMNFDVSSVMPTLLTLLRMIPWDVMGEVESAIQQGVNRRDGRGMDQPPRAIDMVQWLYDGMRDALAPTITLPPVPGNYANRQTMAHSMGRDVDIPGGTYVLTIDGQEFSFTLAPTNLAPGQGMNNTARTDGPAITNARSGMRVTFEPAGVANANGLQSTVTSVIQGSLPADEEFAERHFYFENTTLAPITIVGGTYSIVEGRTYEFNIPTTTLASGQATSVFVSTATVGGVDPTWTASGLVNMNNIRPLPGFPAGIMGTYVGGVQGVNADLGRAAVVGFATINNPMSMMFPSASDLLLYNIPVINLTQRLHELAVEFVEAIPHHPPPFQTFVPINGVFVAYNYRVTRPADGVAEAEEDIVVASASSLPNINYSGLRLVVQAILSTGTPPGNRRNDTLTLLNFAFPDLGNIEAEVKFAAPLVGGEFIQNWFSRWWGQEQLTYIGLEADLANIFNQPGWSVSGARVLMARLRFRYTYLPIGVDDIDIPIPDRPPRPPGFIPIWNDMHTPPETAASAREGDFVINVGNSRITPEASIVGGNASLSVGQLGRVTSLGGGIAGVTVEETDQRGLTSHWQFVFSSNRQRLTMSGPCDVMELIYDARERMLTLRNTQNGQLVTMRLSAVRWFMLALLLLIPVEVI